MKISKKIKIGAARYRVKYEKGSFASIDPKEARKEGKCFIGEHVPGLRILRIAMRDYKKKMTERTRFQV